MIYDKIINLNNYKGLFHHLDTAIDWLKVNDLNTLPLGRTDIDGDNVYISVVECNTRPANQAEYETHTRYMDIHLDIVGAEDFQVSHANMVETTPYNSDTDIALYEADATNEGVLGEECFAIFLVGEAHKPCVSLKGEINPIKKAIMKVAQI